MKIKNFVVKDNALINASYSLSLAEQRIILLAISKYKESAKNEDTGIVITANDYVSNFKTERQSAYETLSASCLSLYNKSFTYQSVEDGKIISYKCRWLFKIGYYKEQGSILLKFTPEVLPLIGQLEKRFTSYHINDISNLTSSYAIRLYEIILSWKSAKKTPIFTIEELKQKIGVEDGQYLAICDFKKRVINLAIAQINSKSNILVEYTQHKQGKKVIGFSFTFVEIKSKPEGRDPYTVDFIENKTDAEIEKTKRIKITRQEAEKMAKIGETWEELLHRIGKTHHVLM